MFRGIRIVGGLVAVLAISAAPALAQRTNSSGETTGSAVARGGDAGGGAASRPADPGPSSAGGGGGDTWSAPPARPNPTAPPSRSVEREQRRGGSRNDGGGEPAAERPRAVPRDSSDSGSAPRPGSSDRTAGATSSDDGSDRRTAVGRERAGRPRTGTAVDRGDAPVLPGRDWVRYYPVSPYGRYYWPGYGFGLGYFFDPFWYDPYGYGYGGGYYGSPYYGGASSYGGGYGSASYAKGPTGSLRLKIDPRDAEVYVDGYYAGLVDDFDGAFQKLTVEAGARRIEIRAEGYEPARIEVQVEPGKTLTYEGSLEPRP